MRTAATTAFIIMGITALTGGCIYRGFIGAQEQFERTVQLSEPLTPGSELAAQTSNGAITVTGTDTQACSLTATIRAHAKTEERARQLAEQTQIRLEQTDRGRRAVIDRPETDRREWVNVSYDIQLPHRTVLHLQTSNGRINLSAIEEAVTAQTSNGAIDITAVTGTVSARTSNGSVTIRQARAPSLELHTSNGAIKCEDITGPVKASTSNGSVNIRYAPDADPATDIRITTSNGGIHLTTPENYSARVDAATSNGKIRSTVPITVQGDMGKTVNGVIRDGKGNLYLRTSNSSITID